MRAHLRRWQWSLPDLGTGPVFRAFTVVAVVSTGCSDLGAPVRSRAALSALSLDFGTVVVGQSTTRNLTVGNNGTGALVGSATLSGTGYELVSGGDEFSLGPGEDLSIEVRFTPPASGTFQSILDLGPESPQVSLTGAGAQQAAGAACAVDPPAIDFGFVASGQSITASFQVRSVGTAPLLVNVVSTAADVQTTEGGGSAVLAPGASITVTLSFTPRVSGRLSGSIAVGPGCPDEVIQGVGTTVSFATDVYPFLTRSCSCHTGGSGPRFLGNQSTTYTLLVNRVSTGYRPSVRIKPFDVAQSVLYGKISNSGQFGGAMPGGSLLQRNMIKAWILEGATNN